MRALTLVLIASMLPGSAVAASWLVNPDGSGDFATLQAAIDGSATGDTIRLGEGIFTGSGNRELVIPRPRLLAAAGEPNTAILDADDLPFGDMGEDPDASEVFRFEGITFRSGNGFEARWNKQVEMADCRFENCASLVRVLPYVIPLGSIAATDCSFIGCQGALDARGVVLTNCSFLYGVGNLVGCTELDAQDCLFYGNSAMDQGLGTLFFLEAFEYDCHYRFAGCSFQNNAADALIWNSNGDLLLESCSIVDNQGAASSDLRVETAEAVSAFDRCLFAFRGEGSLLNLQPAASVPQFTDCDLYGNAGGDWMGEIAGQYGVGCNMSANPQFCNWVGGDLTLYDTSPCLPANNACGVQIGAKGEGCTDLTAAEASPGSALRLSAHPNPFNPAVRLRFTLETAGRTSLSIHDAAGRRVAALLDGAALSAGEQVIDWNAAGLASGVYLARLSTETEDQALKLMLVR